MLAGLDVARFAHAAGNEIIRIGFVGCGNRGTGACRDALSTKGPVKLVAVGDLFPERLERSVANLKKYPELRARMDVPDERKFTGFDAYQKVIDAGVDLVLLATPPHFRPMQYAAAVQAGKHVFMEKPLCVDGPGYRTLAAANEEAKKEETLRRGRSPAPPPAETTSTAFRRSATGPSATSCSFARISTWGAVAPVRPKPDGMSEMEYQSSPLESLLLALRRSPGRAGVP